MTFQICIMAKCSHAHGADYPKCLFNECIEDNNYISMNKRENRPPLPWQNNIGHCLSKHCSLYPDISATFSACLMLHCKE